MYIGGLGNGVLCRGHRAISSHRLKYACFVSIEGLDWFATKICHAKDLARQS